MKQEILVPQKEVSEYKSQLSFIKESVDSLTIKTPEDMAKSSDMLSSIKLIEDSITERKNAITRPLMNSLSSVRELFKPLETICIDAKKTIKQKILDYSIAEEERINKEKERVEARLEKGTIRQDTAIRKIENIGDVQKSFTGANSKTSIRVVTKVRVVDESLIPREWLEPSMSRIQEAVLRQKITIPGIETYEEKSIVASSR